jgi:hypothetical protein
MNAKVIAKNQEIWLIECPFRLHDEAAIILNDILQEHFDMAVTMENGRTRAGAGSFNGYVNLIQCGTKGASKIPDGGLRLNFNSARSRVSYPLIIEVALRNETLRQLVIEGSNWLNEYTDTDLAVLLRINENSRRTNVVSFDLVVFKRIKPFFTDNIFHPIPECKRWLCETDQKVRELPFAELEEHLQIQVLMCQNVSRSSLEARQRVEVVLPLSGMNQFYHPLEPFGPERITIDLTDHFDQLFDMINESVDMGIYPNLTI